MIGIDDLLKTLFQDVADAGRDTTPGELVRSSLAGQMPSGGPSGGGMSLPMALGGPRGLPRVPGPPPVPGPSLPSARSSAAPVQVAQAPNIPGNALTDFSQGYSSGGLIGAIGNLMQGPETRAAMAQQYQRQQAEAQAQRNMTIDAIRSRHKDMPPEVAAVIARDPKLLQEYLGLPDPMKGLTNDAKNYEIARRDPEFKKFLLEDKKAGASSVSVTTKGPSEVDKAAAGEWMDWYAKGLRSDAMNQIDTLDSAIKKMRSIPNITGMRSGIVSMFGEGAQNAFTPEMKDVRQDVEQVAQRSLKAVLGAQFARVEGEMLLERAFNPWLSPEVNARRAERLMAVAKDMAIAKDRYLGAFQANGFSMPTDPEAFQMPGLSELEKLKKEWEAEDRRSGIPLGREGKVPTENHVKMLRQNPDRAAEFDQKFGKGAAALILGGGR